MEREWHHDIETLRPSVFRIVTPQMSGTGFLISRSKTAPIVAIATAAHVIQHAHYWEQPIRVEHLESGQSLLLRNKDRGIVVHSNRDTAAIMFELGNLPLPSSPPALLEQKFHMKPGVTMGWLGLPALPVAGLCFFSGPVSAWLDDDEAYLLDGVAINGVSGGPAFVVGVDGPEITGVVSAYIPNRNTGEALPGLAVVRSIEEFHDIAARFKDLDEAHAKQTPPAEVTPVAPADAPKRGS